MGEASRESSPGLVGDTVQAREARDVREDGSMDETASRGRGVANFKRRKNARLECNRVGCDGAACWRAGVSMIHSTAPESQRTAKDAPSMAVMQ